MPSWRRADGEDSKGLSPAYVHNAAPPCNTRWRAHNQWWQQNSPEKVTNSMSETTTPVQSPAPYVPQIRLYQDWLQANRGLSFATYRDLWNWSITDLDAYWQSVWDYFGMQSPTPHTAVLAKNVMPGAVWFPGAQANYAQQVFRHVAAADAAGFAAVISRNEKGEHRELSWPELRRQVASLALHLQAQGVQPGDRVAAYLPNIPEAMVAFLATVSIGAVWSICAPRHGHECRVGPLPADHAQGADRLRRCALRRARPGPHGRGAIAGRCAAYGAARDPARQHRHAGCTAKRYTFNSYSGRFYGGYSPK